ncbi:MAG: LiaI-LiaF-like domain-containing protein [Chloroflexota bacterium]
MDTQPTTGRPRRGRSILGPLLLIGIGVLFLLNTLNILPWNVWENLWRFWPVILILIGLDIILGRGNPWASAIMGFVVVAIVLALAFAVAFVPVGFTFSGGPNATLEAQSVQVPLDGARSGTVNVNFGAGTLNVSALGSDTGNLVEGSLRHTGGRAIEQQIGRQGDRTTLALSQQGSISILGNNGTEIWQLRLNHSVPLDLNVEGGAVDAHLDLSQLKVNNLYVNLGASSVRLTMPQAAGLTKATFKSGMASLQIDIPQGVAARITSQGGMSSTDVDQGRFPNRGGYYQSPDYDTAANKVEISIEAGMASVRVR